VKKKLEEALKLKEQEAAEQKKTALLV